MGDKNVAKTANVWIGAETGLLKSVDLVKKIATNHFVKESYGKEHELYAMCWDHEKKNTLFTAHKGGVVRQFDMEVGNFINSFELPEMTLEKEKLVGFCRTEEGFVTGTSDGFIKTWIMSDKLESTVSISAGNDLLSLVYNPESKFVASGGKETSLKLWDLNAPGEPIFKARNVKHDWLQLRVPIWVTNVRFLTNSSQILTTTGAHHLRVYDPTSQTRRPVLQSEFSEYPITAAAVSQRNPNLVLVGNTHGEVASFDRRKFRHELRRFRGFAGSVRSIVCHESLPYFFSCGLDRHLHVHDENQSKILQKVYLKSRLNCLLVTDLDLEEKEEDAPDLKRKAEEEENADVEEMWKEMGEVEDRLVEEESEEQEAEVVKPVVQIDDSLDCKKVKKPRLKKRKTKL